MGGSAGMATWALAGLLGAAALQEPAETPVEEAPELGRVRWGRSLDEARATAAQAVLPIALLFQRVPGSPAAREFGRTALSHPLLVEVLETEFVPVRAIKGDPRDADVLRRYGEPATGGPVLRFLDSHGSDLVPRRGEFADTHGLAVRLIEVIEILGHPAPAYLQLVAEEAAPGPREHAWIEVPDDAEAEVELGRIPGVVATRAAMLAGRDAVDVVFRPAVLTFRDLIERASAAGAATFVFARDDAQLEIARRVLRGRARRVDATDQLEPDWKAKPHLQRSHLRYLPLTPMQAMRTNADLATGRDPARWLSPRQIRLAILLARAEQRSPGLLAELAPPADPAEVPAYEREIRRRLKQTAERAAEE